MGRRAAKRRPAAGRRSGSAGFFKVVAYMLLMGVVGAWIGALAIPAAVKLGLAPQAAFRIPYWAFFVGMGIGLEIGQSPSVRHFFVALLGSAVLGAVFWIFALVAEAVLIACGVPPQYVEWLSPLAFCCGVGLGLFAISVTAYDRIASFLARFSTKRGADGPAPPSQKL